MIHWIELCLKPAFLWGFCCELRQFSRLNWMHAHPIIETCEYVTSAFENSADGVYRIPILGYISSNLDPFKYI